MKFGRHQQCSGSHSTQKASLFQEPWKEYTAYVSPSRGASIVRLHLPRRKELVELPSIAGKDLAAICVRDFSKCSAEFETKLTTEGGPKGTGEIAVAYSDQEQTEGKWCSLLSTKRSKSRPEI